MAHCPQDWHFTCWQSEQVKGSLYMHGKHDGCVDTINSIVCWHVTALPPGTCL